ncbi:MAG: MMPL family transporter, partial [Spirochaetaceae bacterium]|nr:MMPL family transporter [Spirochaetaceae bacterium]
LQPVGTAFVMKEMNDQIIPQQLASLGLAAVLVFLLTALTQRSIWLGLASTTPIIITLVTLYGVMGYARIDLSIITGIMSGLTIGVGIDYAIHYVSLLKQARKRGDDPQPRAASRETIANNGRANANTIAATMGINPSLNLRSSASSLRWNSRRSTSSFSSRSSVSSFVIRSSVRFRSQSSIRSTFSPKPGGEHAGSLRLT